MKTISYLFTAFLLCCSIAVPNANSQNSYGQTVRQNALPTVFVLGEFDEKYEEIMPGYKTLLDVCDGSMEVAFGKLQSMMKEMEAFAELSGYDVKGINAWMHFFWRENGAIEHIGFHLKPNSKNVDLDGFKAFLADFARIYKFPMNAKTKYSHYSSFSFPMVFNTNMPKEDTAKNGN